MIAKLMLRSIRSAKARFLTAAAGVAIATGSVVFVSSLVATNSEQAPILASRAARPFEAWKVEGIKTRRGSPVREKASRSEESKPRAGAIGQDSQAKPDLVLRAASLSIDYRPGGRVLQGPPMMALVAEDPGGNPYDAARLVEGRWIEPGSDANEIVCVRKAMMRFGAEPPELGQELKFVGRNGVMSAKIVGYIDSDLKLPSQFPNVFASKSAFGELEKESPGRISFFRKKPAHEIPGLLVPESEEVSRVYKSDDNKRMDYSKPLLLIAAILSALALLVNSLLIAVESNRRNIALLRLVGLGKAGVAKMVIWEALFSSLAGAVAGIVAAMLALETYVAFDGEVFPAGAVFDFKTIFSWLAGAAILSLAASLFALRPALRVRALDAFSTRPRSRRKGMAIAFSLGFAAFVAVEVWGASLMRAFVPSPEWPDAIVSILPEGVSSFDIEKLRDMEGVRRISELEPLQVYFGEDESVPGDETGAKEDARPRARSNALFLAAEWLPRFKFVEGTYDEAAQAVFDDGEVVICQMISRARNLHKGDDLVVEVASPRSKEKVSLRIAGVVDVNWHMVTSRGLVRGLNGMPGMTDGPVFASFDTVESLMAGPAFNRKMTHLWVEYDSGFLSRHGVFQSGRIIERSIASRLDAGDGSTIRLHARDEIADGTLAHGDDLIGEAARVPFFFLAILAIGFIAMLIAEAEARKHELATLRAIGATRLDLASRLARSALGVSLAGISIALPLGTAAGFFASMKTASIWPGMPHYLVFPWRTVALGALGAVAFALAFAIPASLAITGRLTRRKQSPSAAGCRFVARFWAGLSGRKMV